MFKDLLPPATAVCHATSKMWETTVRPDEEAHIANAVEKRKREFRAGRNAARQALCQLDSQFNPHTTSLLPGEKRQPLWPDHIAGAITHSADQCYAAVALKSNIKSLGIDVEESEPLQSNILKMICTPEEIKWLSSLKDGLFWAKLIFSAKESIYKTYFPICHSYLDFLEATLEIDRANETFSATILVDTCDTLGTQTLEGRFTITDNFVYTAVWL
ncbi:MAG: 4'-phosphopantetheinyl transferase superfamily protein [Pseudomonadales bacterium]|nr:4'-phosphopantetheinyl transferase superfamily protein [Pseudomonadales bacterium]